MYIKRKEFKRLRNQLAAFKRGEVNLIKGVDGASREAPIKALSAPLDEDDGKLFSRQIFNTPLP